MGMKAQEQIDGCFARARPDELLFVLREGDVLAPALIDAWAEQYRKKHLDRGTQGRELARVINKYTDAKELAVAMLGRQGLNVNVTVSIKTEAS